jgi:hypothetical protein
VLGLEINPDVLQGLALALGPLAVFYTPTEQVDAVLMEVEPTLLSGTQPTRDSTPD